MQNCESTLQMSSSSKSPQPIFMGESQPYEEKKSCYKASLSKEGSLAPDKYVDMDIVSIRCCWLSFKISNASSDVVQCLVTSTEKLAQTSKKDDLILSRSSSTRRDPAKDTVLKLTTNTRSKTISHNHPMVPAASSAMLGMVTEGNNLPRCRTQGSLLSKTTTQSYICLFRLIILLLKIFHFQLQKENQQSDEGCSSTSSKSSTAL